MYKHYIGNRGGGKTQAMTQELMNRCNQLEKALDKACEWIVNYIGECPMAQFDECLSNCEENCCDDFVGCWKEWLLKEVQEDD